MSRWEDYEGEGEEEGSEGLRGRCESEGEEEEGDGQEGGNQGT